MQTQSSPSSQSSSDTLSSDDNFLSSDSDESDVFLTDGPASSSRAGGSGSGGGGVAAVDRGGGRVAWRTYSVTVKEEEVNEAASDRSYGSESSAGSTSGHHRGQHLGGGGSTSSHHRGQQQGSGCSTSGHHRGQQLGGGSSTSSHHRGQQQGGAGSTSGHHRGQQKKDTTAHNAKTHGDLLFSQKCAELQGFVRPLLDLLKGLKRGRFDRGLSSLQQTEAMDRIQRIIGVLQRPNSGEKYLNTILKVEMMLKNWFPQVPTNSALSAAAAATAPPDLSQLGGAPADSAPPQTHRDQRHIPVKKRRLSWTGTDTPSPSTSPVPAKKQPRRHGKEDEEDEEHEEVAEETTREKREGETLSLGKDPGRAGQTGRTERTTKEERTEERTAVPL